MRKQLKAALIKHARSTTGHRNAQRGNGISELVNVTFSSFNPIAVIPGKLAQTGISFFSMTRRETKSSERFIHVLQGSISLIQMILAMILYLDGNECSDTTHQLCKAVILCDLLYRGTLIVGWAPGECSKESYAPRPLEDAALSAQQLGQPLPAALDDNNALNGVEIHRL